MSQIGSSLCYVSVLVLEWPGGEFVFYKPTPQMGDSEQTRLRLYPVGDMSGAG